MWKSIRWQKCLCTHFNITDNTNKGTNYTKQASEWLDKLPVYDLWLPSYIIKLFKWR